MNKLFLQAGAILGLLGVAFGAFGAHALEKMLEASGSTATFETAVKYQFYHALVLILIGLLFKEIPTKVMTYSGYCMLVGVLIFSGSLYTICFTGIKMFGAVAPIGGTLLIAGWGLLFYAVSRTT
jgi:uncharacterized membrane protein YgdD (TMEM256/DUF423 family)